MAVEEAIKGLVAANRTLTTGGAQLPVLQYDQARDLVAAVALIAKRPIVLILDQWEKSPDAALEAKTLSTFLHNLEDWPNCHVFIGLRPDEPAFAIVERLIAGRPGPAQLHRLRPMALEVVAERERLVRFIQESVSGAGAVDAGELLKMIDGYPGVIYQWSSDYQQANMSSLEDLAGVAEDAQKYRFSELGQLLPALDDGQRQMAIRLALLPLGGTESWPQIKAEVLNGLNETLVEDLKLAKVLDGADPPSFGHAKRWEAAQAWLFEHRKASARIEASSLTLKLAEQIRDLSPEAAHHAATLRALLPICWQLDLDDVSIALCQAAATLFGDSSGVDESLTRGAALTRAAENSALAPLLAMGLRNAQYDAKAEDELDRRDGLLVELRCLAGTWPGDAAVREQLAKGLYNTLLDAKAEDDLGRRDQLLAELQSLAGTWPDDDAVREQLSGGLFSTLINANEEEARGRRDQLLGELQSLAGAWPDDDAVRELLARGLLNALSYAKFEGDLDRRDEMLGDVRSLAEAWPGDANVREQLAMGLANTLNHAMDEDNLERRGQLLGELRSLAAAWPDDAAVRARLARGLARVAYGAEQDGEAAKRALLLDELKTLAQQHSGEAWVAQLAEAGVLDPGS